MHLIRLSVSLVAVTLQRSDRLCFIQMTWDAELLDNGLNPILAHRSNKPHSDCDSLSVDRGWSTDKLRVGSRKGFCTRPVRGNAFHQSIDSLGVGAASRRDGILLDGIISGGTSPVQKGTGQPLHYLECQHEPQFALNVTKTHNYNRNRASADHSGAKCSN